MATPNKTSEVEKASEVLFLLIGDIVPARAEGRSRQMGPERKKRQANVVEAQQKLAKTQATQFEVQIHQEELARKLAELEKDYPIGLAR